MRPLNDPLDGLLIERDSLRAQLATAQERERHLSSLLKGSAVYEIEIKRLHGILDDAYEREHLANERAEAGRKRAVQELRRVAAGMRETLHLNNWRDTATPTVERLADEIEREGQGR